MYCQCQALQRDTVQFFCYFTCNVGNVEILFFCNILLELSIGHQPEDNSKRLKVLVEQLKVAADLLQVPLEDVVGDGDLEILGQGHHHVLKHLAALGCT